MDYPVNAKIHALRFFDTDGMVGNAIPYEEDHRKLVVCEENTVYKLDLDTKEKTHLVEMLDPDSPVQTRINDGKCDARGRLWAGA